MSCDIGKDCTSKPASKRRGNPVGKGAHRPATGKGVQGGGGGRDEENLSVSLEGAAPFLSPREGRSEVQKNQAVQRKNCCNPGRNQLV